MTKSLLDLKLCMTAMGDRRIGGQAEYIQYRNSRLTRLFKSYFESNGLVKMVVNLNPNLNTFDESIMVLEFSAIAKKVYTVEDKKGG